MIMKLRQRATIIMIIVLVAFVGMMVLGWGMDVTGRGGRGVRSRRNVDVATLAVINGDELTMDNYIPYLQRVVAEMGQDNWYRMESDDRLGYVIQAWDEAVSDLVWSQALSRERVLVSEEEIIQTIYRIPPPEIQQDPEMYVNGEFDYNRYTQMLNDPNLPEDIRQILTKYMFDLWRELPRDVLRRDLNYGIRITDLQVEDVNFRFGRSITVEALFIYRLPQVDTAITEAEILAYYEEHPEEFEQAKWWKVRALNFPIIPSGEDSLALKNRMDEISEIMDAGYEFEQISLDLTGDSSRLISREAATYMPPEQKVVLDSLPKGVMSKPYFSQGAWHISLIEKSTRDSLVYRDIQLPLQAGGETRRQIIDRVEELRTRARKENIDSLIAEYGIPRGFETTVREDRKLYIPRFPFSEGVKTFAVGSDVGDLSKIFPEFMGVYSCFLTVETGGPGVLPLDDVRVLVRRKVIARRRMDAQEELAFKLRNLLEQGADFATLRNDPVLNPGDSLLSTPVLEFSSYFGAETRYDSRLAGACYALDVGEMTGPVRNSVGYGFFRCVDAVYDPASDMVSQGIENETNMILNNITKKLFDVSEIEDYRRADNFSF